MLVNTGCCSVDHKLLKFVMCIDCSWEVNAQDRMGGTPNISRYYAQTASRVRCLNCKERGHLAKDCTQPKVR